MIPGRCRPDPVTSRMRGDAAWNQKENSLQRVVIEKISLLCGVFESGSDRDRVTRPEYEIKMLSRRCRSVAEGGAT